MAESDREKHQKLDTQAATWLVLLRDDGEGKEVGDGRREARTDRLGIGDPVTGSHWKMNVYSSEEGIRTG